MKQLEITKKDDNDINLVFEVKVIEETGSTLHNVTLDKNYFASLKSSSTPEVFIRKSFEFLLKREAKELILKDFDIRQIATFFPEYDSEVKNF